MSCSCARARKPMKHAFCKLAACINRAVSRDACESTDPARGYLIWRRRAHRGVLLTGPCDIESAGVYLSNGGMHVVLRRVATRWIRGWKDVLPRLPQTLCCHVCVVCGGNSVLSYRPESQGNGPFGIGKRADGLLTSSRSSMRPGKKVSRVNQHTK